MQEGGAVKGLKALLTKAPAALRKANGGRIRFPMASRKLRR
jgi:hypothetical protein